MIKIHKAYYGVCVLILLLFIFIYVCFINSKGHDSKNESLVPIIIPDKYNIELLADSVITSRWEYEGDSVCLLINVVNEEIISLASPFCLQVITKENGEKTQLYAKQYDLKGRENRIMMPIKGFPNKGEIWIGYFLLQELYTDRPKKYYSLVYPFSNSKKNGFKLEIAEEENSFLELESKEVNLLRHYYYANDINSDFKGFVNKQNQLLNESCKIELNMGSIYKGALKDGLFQGKGVYYDALVGRTLCGNFTKGVIKQMDSLDSNICNHIVDIPILSKAYPIFKSYRQEALFVYGINTERVFWIWNIGKRGESKKYREIWKFDSKGKMYERQWRDIDNYYYDEGCYPLGIKPKGGNRSVGVAKIEFTYDNNGDIIWEKYYDSKGELLREGPNGIIGHTPIFEPLKLDDIVK